MLKENQQNQENMIVEERSKSKIYTVLRGMQFLYSFISIVQAISYQYITDLFKIDSSFNINSELDLNDDLLLPSKLINPSKLAYKHYKRGRGGFTCAKRAQSVHILFCLFIKVCFRYHLLKTFQHHHKFIICLHASSQRANTFWCISPFRWQCYQI